MKIPSKNSKMKRIGNLFEKIVSIENLKLADKKARKGKLKSYGIKLHDRNQENNILNLHGSLKSGNFKTSKYHIFTIIADNNKERVIYQLPYYPDRILHHAIMNIMEPIWVSTFTTNTYSCIKNRGIHGVVRKLKSDLKDIGGTIYCLKLDIRKYYPSIDHDILKQIIRKKIKDNRLLVLLDEIIDSAPGIPIGNYLSQFFANLYLTYFDHYLKEQLKVKHYYRYADDMVILSSSKDELHSLLSIIREYFTNNLKLELNNNYQIFPVDIIGIDFVGYVFRHNYILMRKSIKKRFAKKVSKLKKLKVKGKDFDNQICSWLGWAKHCNSKHLIKILLSETI